jgi:uncharacterized RDD family membrane protein YckC
MSAEATMETRGGGRRPAYRLHYASFESRVAAGALDVLVMFIIAALLVTAGSLIVLISSDFERVEPSSTALSAFWVCVGLIPVALVLYFFIGLAWKGQTVGAAVMQLMVVRSDGRPLGVLGAMARVIGQLFYVLLAGIGIVAAYALRESTVLAGAALGVAFVLAAGGILWAAFDRHRRTLHDRLAGTIVVRLV